MSFKDCESFEKYGSFGNLGRGFGSGLMNDGCSNDGCNNVDVYVSENVNKGVTENVTEKVTENVRYNVANDNYSNQDNNQLSSDNDVNGEAINFDYSKVYQMKLLKFMKLGVSIESGVRQVASPSVEEFNMLMKLKNGEIGKTNKVNFNSNDSNDSNGSNDSNDSNDSNNNTSENINNVIFYTVKISVPEMSTIGESGMELKEKFEKEIGDVLGCEWKQVVNGDKYRKMVEERYKEGLGRIKDACGWNEGDSSSESVNDKDFNDYSDTKDTNADDSITAKILNNINNKKVILISNCTVRENEVWTNMDRYRIEGLMKDAGEVIKVVGRDEFRRMGKKMKEFMEWVREKYGEEKVKEIRECVEECNGVIRGLGRDMDGLVGDGVKGLNVESDDIDVNDVGEVMEKIEEKMREVMGDEVWERWREVVGGMMEGEE